MPLAVKVQDEPSNEVKTRSLKGGAGIGKLSRHAGVSAAGARSRNPERSEGSLTDSPPPSQCVIPLVAP